jgi:hypothetical protein
MLFEACDWELVSIFVHNFFLSRALQKAPQIVMPDIFEERDWRSSEEKK